MLVAPALEGANRLDIVSGYATPALASTHLAALADRKLHVDVNLVVGMVQHEGLRVDFHRGFANLASERPEFAAYYVMPPQTVHSKVYVWYSNGEPVVAFSGSANYTRTGMGTGAVGRQRTETMSEVDCDVADRFMAQVFANVIGCVDPDVSEFVRLTSANVKPGESELARADEVVPTMGDRQPGVGAEFAATVSLLNRYGHAHNAGGGLNHGMRENRKNKNEAYIPIPSALARSDFFPPRGQHFLVTTDDDKTLLLSTGSGKPGTPKDLRTPMNNALLGEYFRNRLGVASGALITDEHFERYGRSAVEFLKLDDETYIMDFAQS